MLVFILSLIAFLSIIFQFLFFLFFILWLFYLLLRKTLAKDTSKLHPDTLKNENKLLNIDNWFFNLLFLQHIIMIICVPTSWAILFIYCNILKNKHERKLYINLKKSKYLKYNQSMKLQLGKIKNNLYRNLKTFHSYNQIKLNKNYNYINNKHSKNKKQIDYNSIEYIDILSGTEFEKYISNLLNKLGYINVKLTPASNDYGVDIIAEKDDVKFAIQCKHYSGKVSNSSIQEANSGKQFYNCHIGVVVTNNYFTPNAIALAKNNGIILWDRDKLKKMLKIANDEV